MRWAGVLLALLIETLPQLLLADAGSGPAEPPDRQPGSSEEFHTCLVGSPLECAVADSIHPLWVDSAHFRVHFAAAGANAVPGWPSTAYVDSLVSALEKAYVCFRDTLGLPAAVAGGEESGGAGLLDCFVHRFTDQYLGRAYLDSCRSVPPCPRCWGHFSLDNSMGWSWLRRTAAHEYFHLVQYGLDASEAGWFKESTATWSEKASFPRDPRYDWAMYSWFATPYLGLWGESGWRNYGAVHYWVYLEEVYGRSFIPDLWRRCCGSDWLTVLEEMLRSRGTSFNESLVRHALWCNATGIHDDGRHFREASHYPTIGCQRVHRLYPVERTSLPADSLARAAASNYIRFLGPGSRDSLHIAVAGHSELRDRRNYSLVITRDGKHHTEWTRTPDDGGDAEFTVPAWSTCDYVTLIVTNFKEADRNWEFEYSAQESGSAVPLRVSDLTCSPNPFHLGTKIRFDAWGMPQPAGIAIYDVQGRRVRDLPVGRVDQGEIRVAWDGRDPRGLLLPYGCYFVRAQFGTASATTKIFYLQ